MAESSWQAWLAFGFVAFWFGAAATVLVRRLKSVCDRLYEVARLNGVLAEHQAELGAQLALQVASVHAGVPAPLPSRRAAPKRVASMATASAGGGGWAQQPIVSRASLYGSYRPPTPSLGSLDRLLEQHARELPSFLVGAAALNAPGSLVKQLAGRLVEAEGAAPEEFVDPRGLVQEAVRGASQRLDDLEVEIVWALDPTPTVRVDRASVVEVLSELLDYALDDLLVEGAERTLRVGLQVDEDEIEFAFEAYVPRTSNPAPLTLRLPWTVNPATAS